MSRDNTLSSAFLQNSFSISTLFFPKRQGVLFGAKFLYIFLSQGYVYKPSAVYYGDIWDSLSAILSFQAENVQIPCKTEVIFAFFLLETGMLMHRTTLTAQGQKGRPGTPVFPVRLATPVVCASRASCVQHNTGKVAPFPSCRPRVSSTCTARVATSLFLSRYCGPSAQKHWPRDFSLRR